MNKHFNKNLIMSEREQHLFQQSNSCWICKKLVDNDEEKVRDHCHVTGKFRGEAHWDCNMSDEDFKYLVEEFSSKNLELLKRKGDYPYEYMNSFERFNEENLSARKYFYSSTKDGKIDDDRKISDGHISVKDYLTCEKIWDKFEMKNMGDYHNHYLKKDVLLLADVFEKFIATCLKFSAMRCQLMKKVQ